jgi:hypothetical protein
VEQQNGLRKAARQQLSYHSGSILAIVLDSVKGVFGDFVPFMLRPALILPKEIAQVVYVPILFFNIEIVGRGTRALPVLGPGPY